METCPTCGSETYDPKTRKVYKFTWPEGDETKEARVLAHSKDIAISILTASGKTDRRTGTIIVS